MVNLDYISESKKLSLSQDVTAFLSSYLLHSYHLRRNIMIVSAVIELQCYNPRSIFDVLASSHPFCPKDRKTGSDFVGLPPQNSAYSTYVRDYII